MIKTILLYSSLFLVACSQSTSNESSDGLFAIYLLQDSTLTAQNTFSQPIKNLKLNSLAFLTANDLKSYKWDLHSFELKDQMRDKYEQFKLTQGSTNGVPFVVTVGNERIYYGTFWWGYSSSMPPACAVINATSQLPHRIQLATGATDKRSDLRIFYSLRQSGVLDEYFPGSIF